MSNIETEQNTLLKDYMEGVEKHLNNTNGEIIKINNDDVTQNIVITKPKKKRSKKQLPKVIEDNNINNDVTQNIINACDKDGNYAISYKHQWPTYNKIINVSNLLNYANDLNELDKLITIHNKTKNTYTPNDVDNVNKLIEQEILTFIKKNINNFSEQTIKDINKTFYDNKKYIYIKNYKKEKYNNDETYRQKIMNTNKKAYKKKSQKEKDEMLKNIDDIKPSDVVTENN